MRAEPLPAPLEFSRDRRQPARGPFAARCPVARDAARARTPADSRRRLPVPIRARRERRAIQLDERLAGPYALAGRYEHAHHARRRRRAQGSDVTRARDDGADRADGLRERLQRGEGGRRVDHGRRCISLAAVLRLARRHCDQRDDCGQSFHRLGVPVGVASVSVSARSSAVAIHALARSSTYWPMTSRALRCASSTLASGAAPSRYAVSESVATRFALATSIRSRATLASALSRSRAARPSRSRSQRAPE